MLEYALGILGVIGLASFTRRQDMRDGVIAILMSWLAWCWFIIATGVYEPWHAGIVFDSAAAWWLLRNPSTKLKSVLASIFCVQITMHVGYGTNIIATGSAYWEAYYRQTQITGWLQLLVLGGWAIGHLVGRTMPVWRNFRLESSRQDR